MQRDAQRLAGDLGVAMGYRDRLRLVQRQEQLRGGIAEKIDDAVVQTAKARAGIDREIGDVQAAQQRRDQIAAISRNRLSVRSWFLLGHAFA